MKNLGVIILILFAFSCSIMKFERKDFIEKEYVFAGGQGGAYILRFNNKDVWYSEFGGLYEGTGTWEIAEEKNFILVKVTTSGPGPLGGRKSTISKYHIKNKDTLVSEDGKVFIRKK